MAVNSTTCQGTIDGATMRTCTDQLARFGARLLASMMIAGCATQVPHESAAAQRLADREAIEEVLNRANLGFELSNPDMFAEAFAEDAEYVLDEKGPVFGYDKLIYKGRAEIRTIITARLQKAQARDPKTLTYDPRSLRRYNRNSDDRIVLLDANTARHVSTWMVVMKTNVNIHISAIGRYDDRLEKRSGKWLIVRRVRTE
jgi:SnoaL-like domain